jgi:hypothetical protein
MGNTNSKRKFGTITSTDSSTRPGYYISTSKVVFKGEPLALSPDELSSFKKLKYGYAKNNKNVYYKGIIIPEADSKTFEIVNRPQVKDIAPQYNNLNSVLGMDYYQKQKRFFYKGALAYNKI